MFVPDAGPQRLAFARSNIAVAALGVISESVNNTDT
jgi:hypothetical protein